MRYEGEPVFYKYGKVYWRGEVFDYDHWRIDKSLVDHPILLKHSQHRMAQYIENALMNPSLMSGILPAKKEA